MKKGKSIRVTLEDVEEMGGKMGVTRHRSQTGGVGGWLGLDCRRHERDDGGLLILGDRGWGCWRGRCSCALGSAVCPIAEGASMSQGCTVWDVPARTVDVVMHAVAETEEAALLPGSLLHISWLLTDGVRKLMV